MTEDDIDFATMSAYQLIEFLDAAYPHTCIRAGEPEYLAHRYAGRRELVDELVRAKEAEIEARE